MLFPARFSRRYIRVEKKIVQIRPGLVNAPGAPRPSCTRVNTAYMYIFIHNTHRERERGRKKDEETKREKERNACKRAQYIHTHIYMRTSLTPPLRMHAIPFHAHIIKSPKSREIAPRRACQLCSLDHLSISPAIGYPFRLFPSLGSPLARSRTYTVACHIGSLFNFVDRTKRDMCSRYLWG